MLTIYRSNKAEWLAEVLGQELRLDPPDITTEVDIIVSSWPSSRWLSEQLSVINGINALVNFPFPGIYLKKLLNIILEIDSNESNPWEKKYLVWHIIELLPELIKEEEASIIKSWLEEKPQDGYQVNMYIWELVNSIADVFNEYILFRPKMIYEWIKTDLATISRQNSLGENYLWQVILFKLLYKKLKKDPFSVQVHKAINILKNNDISNLKLPKNLYIFGLSSLAPLQVDLVQALSKAIEIKIFIISPCNNLWQRCEKRRLQYGNEWNKNSDRKWLLESPRIEATLGRMGAEFQQLLEGSGEYQLGEWDDQGLFSMSANIAINKGQTASLLEQLQQELLSSENNSFSTKELNDNSLLFLKSPSKRRQVELIRDQILNFLANDKTLQPKDILIMTPQLSSYSPIFASVFNNIPTSDIELPWTITDRSQEDKVGIIHFVLSLLDISSKRLTASSLDSLLSNPVLQKQQNISAEEIETISNHLQETGFTWGLDASDRLGENEHSLSWCLERWLLGIILPNDVNNSAKEIAPFSKGITHLEIINSWGLLTNIFKYIEEFRKFHKCNEWVDLLKSIILDFFGDGGDWIWEVQQLLNIIDNWHSMTIDFQLDIDSSVVKDLITQSLRSASGKFGHRSGKITISALEPMRAIPHRVIVIMGLEGKTFPRANSRTSFNILEKSWELGDPNQNDKDRYSLLEALISSRQHLLLSWNCREERTGEELEPSSPVQQWLNYLKIKLGLAIYKNIIIEAPSNPLDIQNFIKSSTIQILSCDQRHLEARKLIDKAKSPSQISLALPLKWDRTSPSKATFISYEQTKEWLLEPQISWLKENNIQSKEFNNIIEDNDYLELSELDRYILLKERLENHEVNEVIRNENEQHYWKKNYSGTGVFPPKSSGVIEEELLEKRWRNLNSILKQLGEYKKKSLKINNLEKDFHFAGNNLIKIEIGSLKYKTVMEGWLNHLCISAYYPFNSKSLIISRKKRQTIKDNFEISCQFLPISQIDANKSLIKLEELARKGRKDCWPIPPESGLALALNNNKMNSPNNAFRKKWEGDSYIEGERENLAMQICFGRNCKSSVFLTNESFNFAMIILYEPLLKILKII